MKHLFTLFLFLGAGGATAQTVDSLKFPLDADTHRVTYSEVVPARGTSQPELYTRGKLWFAGTFTSAKDVLQVEEKDAGILQGSGWQTIYTQVMGATAPDKLWYTVKITVKDGRYKYDITDLRLDSNTSGTGTTPIEAFLFVEHKNKTLRNITLSRRALIAEATQKLAAGIKAGMSKPAVGSSAGKSDW